MPQATQAVQWNLVHKIDDVSFSAGQTILIEFKEGAGIAVRSGSEDVTSTKIIAPCTFSVALGPAKAPAYSLHNPALLSTGNDRDGQNLLVTGEVYNVPGIKDGSSVMIDKVHCFHLAGGNVLNMDGKAAARTRFSLEPIAPKARVKRSKAVTATA